jgi:protein-S-isoprenylcysteine O-methyltransferase
VGISLSALGVKAASFKILVGVDAHTLITKGIYSYIRNPICLSCIVLSFSAAIGFKSITGLIAAVLALAIIYLHAVLWEERELKRRFGQQYFDYKKRVGMFIPRLPKVSKE